MSSRFRTPGLIGAMLALALLVPTAAGAAVERTVSVTADATLKVPNDTASLGFSVSKERRTRGAALRAVSGKLRAVVVAVQGISGVGEGDVTTGRISVRKTFRGERPIYRAGEGIGVTLHEPDKAGELVTAAIGAGATGVSGPNFFVGDTEAAFTSALTAAFDKARVRATALATRAGGIRRSSRSQARQPPLHRRPAADQARHLNGHRDRPRRLRPSVAPNEARHRALCQPRIRSRLRTVDLS